MGEAEGVLSGLEQETGWRRGARRKRRGYSKCKVKEADRGKTEELVVTAIESDSLRYEERKRWRAPREAIHDPRSNQLDLQDV